MRIPFKERDQIHIRIPHQEDEEAPCISRIAAFSDQDFTIDIPIYKETGRYAYFPEGMILEFIYYTDNGSQYIFQSKILARKVDNVPLFVIANPDKESINRIQRRKFLRVPCTHEIAIHPDASTEPFDPFVATTIDISAGGAALYTVKKHHVNPEAIIRWWLVLPLSKEEIVYPRGKGKIIRIDKDKQLGNKYVYSLQFVDLSQKYEEILIKYCYERQLQLHKKLN